MINHARTLLLNVTANDTVAAGQEYLPPLFRPVAINDGITTARRILFGVSPTALTRNCRAQQLMALLHATELEQFVLALDPRITYRPNSSALFEDNAETAGRVTSNLGQLAATLSTLNTQSINDIFGITTGDTQNEPFKTFYSLWTTHREMPYQLGGLLLAIIYRTDKIRLGGVTPW